MAFTSALNAALIALTPVTFAQRKSISQRFPPVFPIEGRVISP